MQLGVGCVAKDVWISSEAMELWYLMVRLLSEVSSHFNFTEKFGGLDVGSWDIILSIDP